jgi:hypothetical protein
MSDDLNLGPSGIPTIHGLGGFEELPPLVAPGEAPFITSAELELRRAANRQWLEELAKSDPIVGKLCSWCDEIARVFYLVHLPAHISPSIGARATCLAVLGCFGQQWKGSHTRELSIALEELLNCPSLLLPDFPDDSFLHWEMSRWVELCRCTKNGFELQGVNLTFIKFVNTAQVLYASAIELSRNPQPKQDCGLDQYYTKDLSVDAMLDTEFSRQQKELEKTEEAKLLHSASTDTSFPEASDGVADKTLHDSSFPTAQAESVGVLRGPPQTEKPLTPLESLSVFDFGDGKKVTYPATMTDGERTEACEILVANLLSICGAKKKELADAVGTSHGTISRLSGSTYENASPPALMTVRYFASLAEKLGTKKSHSSITLPPSFLDLSTADQKEITQVLVDMAETLIRRKSHFKAEKQ